MTVWNEIGRHPFTISVKGKTVTDKVTGKIYSISTEDISVLMGGKITGLDAVSASKARYYLRKAGSTSHAAPASPAGATTSADPAAPAGSAVRPAPRKISGAVKDPEILRQYAQELLAKAAAIEEERRRQVDLERRTLQDKFAELAARAAKLGGQLSGQLTITFPDGKVITIGPGAHAGA